MNNPHFLDKSAEEAADPSAPYVVLPLPYERTVSYGSGTAAGPDAILRASRETEDFDEELMTTVNLRVQTLPAPEFRNMKQEACLSMIESIARPVFAEKRFLLSIGGEHSVSAPLIKAARETWKDIAVLHIDAHTDLRREYEGTENSHACVMRRVEETGIDFVSAGIRSFSAGEYNHMKQSNTLDRIIGAKQLAEDPIQKHLQKISGILSNAAFTYVTLDIDALDPSLVPGTGTPEPGGLSWYRLLQILRSTFESQTVIGADIVETSPVPGSQVSEYTAARLGLKMMLYHQALSPGRLPER